MPLSKESVIELQKIDCNCNDCIYMERDLSKPPKKGVPTPISYGYCTQFNKPVSFIPATCQIETQNCFKHRKTINHATN